MSRPPIRRPMAAQQARPCPLCFDPDQFLTTVYRAESFIEHALRCHPELDSVSLWQMPLPKKARRARQ